MKAEKERGKRVKMEIKTEQKLGKEGKLEKLSVNSQYEAEPME